MSWDLVTGLLLAAGVLLGVGYAVKELAGEAIVRFFSEHTAGTSEDPNKRLIGQTGEVVEAADDGTLRVRVGIERWRARPADGAGPLAAGTEVRVARVEGTLLLVEPVAHA